MTDALTVAALVLSVVAYAAGWYAGHAEARRRRYWLLTKTRQRVEYLEALTAALSERCRKQAELLGLKEKEV